MRYKIKIHKSMVFNTVLKIPPKKKILVYAQIILVCFMLWARDVLGVPSAITYITDVITITILFFQFFKIRKGIRGTRVKVQIYIVTAILVCMMLGVVLNLVKPLLVLWGLRNSFRFFVFFLICVGLLSEYDIEKIIAFFKTFFFLNVAMMTFQYFVQGYRDDYLGGFFGTDSGCNAYVCVMLCIITTIVLAEFLKSKISLSTLFVYCVACMYIATLAELKIYFFEFIIIIGFQLLYKNYELIIVDDGSEDNTVAISDFYAERYSAVQVIHSENQGVSSARNLGMEKAIGDYILFLDADDRLIESALDNMVPYTSEAEWVIGNYVMIEEKSGKRIYNRQFFKENIHVGGQNELFELTESRLFHFVWGRLYDRRILQQYQLCFDKKLAYGEDILFNTHYFVHIKKFVVLQKTVYCYNCHLTTGLSNQVTNEWKLQKKICQEI